MTTQSDHGVVALDAGSYTRRDFVRRVTFAVGGAALAGTMLRATLAQIGRAHV